MDPTGSTAPAWNRSTVSRLLTWLPTWLPGAGLTPQKGIDIPNGRLERTGPGHAGLVAGEAVRRGVYSLYPVVCQTMEPARSAGVVASA